MSLAKLDEGFDEDDDESWEGDDSTTPRSTTSNSSFQSTSTLGDRHYVLKLTMPALRGTQLIAFGVCSTLALVLFSFTDESGSEIHFDTPIFTRVNPASSLHGRMRVIITGDSVNIYSDK